VMYCDRNQDAGAQEFEGRKISKASLLVRRFAWQVQRIIMFFALLSPRSACLACAFTRVISIQPTHVLDTYSRLSQFAEMMELRLQTLSTHQSRFQYTHRTGIIKRQPPPHLESINVHRNRKPK
jgi:hypothetical protein